MVVKSGYKTTEVGVIPDEWEVKRLEELGAWKGGMTPSMKNPIFWSNGDVPWISSGDVKSVLLKETAYSITATAVRQGTTTVLPANSIVVVTRSGILRKYLPVAMNVIPMAINQDIKALIPTEKFCPTFLLYALIGNGPRILSRCLKAGTTVESVEFRWLKAFNIPVPSLSEQRAIAGALEDADTLMGALEQLIAKKRDLKQAAMQQLLTPPGAGQAGQTRLPGFTGKWETKRLGDLFTFSGGYSASRDQLSTEGHCYLHYGDIHKSSKTFIDVRAEYQDIPKLDIPLKRVSPSSLLDDGDVVFVDASEDDAGASKHVVVVNKDKKPFISGLHTIVAKSKTDELAHEYRRYCFQTPAIRQQFLFYAVGTKVTGISKTNIPKLTLPVPTVPEQTAIAGVLSDMDAELAALEARLAKTRDLKQGMMQELLTGRTRFV